MVSHARAMLTRAPASWGGSQQVQPLPQPAGPYPYEITSPFPTAATREIHVIGDSGGVKAPQSQQLVANNMVADHQQAPVDFCFHVGDVVYYNGEASEYYSQFYEPYHGYAPAIFAVPGNHDGDPLPGDTSLSGFLRNFCQLGPVVLPESGDSPRSTGIQPNVYFALIDPLVTIIGLYSNVPSGGEIDDIQYRWLVTELEKAGSQALIVALHHPPLSCDAHHGGSAKMLALLDQASTEAGRRPDMVLSGHVHNCQRFERKPALLALATRPATPYIVIGSSGYWNLHGMAKDTTGNPLTYPYQAATDVILKQAVDDHHGFLRLSISKNAIGGQYFTVPRPQDSWSQPAQLVDQFNYSVGGK